MDAERVGYMDRRWVTLKGDGVSLISLFSIGVALLPLCWISPGHPRSGQLVTFMCIGLVAASCKLKNIWLRVLGCYISIWIVVSWLFLTFNPTNKGLLVVAFSTTDTLTYVLCGFVILRAIIELPRSEKWYWSIENGICIGAIIQSLIAVPQYFDVFPFIWFLNYIGIHAGNPVPMVVGTLENTNFFSAYLAISLMLFFRRRWCWFIPIIVSHLVLSNTSSSVVAVLFGTLVYFNIWWVWVICIGSGVVYGWYDDMFSVHSSLTERIKFWSICLNNVKYPIWGHGVGASWGHKWLLWNEYIQMFWYFGAIGVGLIAGYIVTAYRGNRILFSALCVACVNCVGTYLMHLPPSAFLVIIIIGLIERERKWKQKNGVYQAV